MMPKRNNKEGRTKFAHQKRGVCVKHRAKVKQCNEHWAKVKQCNSLGCSNVVVRGGVCIKHWAKSHANYAARKDAKIKLKMKDCASGMGHR